MGKRLLRGFVGSLALAAAVLCQPAGAQSQPEDTDLQLRHQQVFSGVALRHLRALRNLTPKFSAFGRASEAADQSSATLSPPPDSWHFFSDDETGLADPVAGAWSLDREQDRTAGIGYRISDQFMLGTTFYYSGADAQLDVDEPSTADELSLSLFGAYVDRHLFFDSAIGFGQTDYDQLLESSGLEASGASDAQHFFAGLGLGYRIGAGPLMFTPSVRLDYMNIDVAEYRGEQLSADSQALSLQDDEFRSLTSTLGGRIAYEVDQPWGVLVPQLRFAWVHEFEDEASLYRGRLLPQNLASEEDSDTGYSLALDSPERDYFNLGLGLSAEFGGNGAAFLSYEKVFGKKDLSTYSVTGGVRFEF